MIKCIITDSSYSMPINLLRNDNYAVGCCCVSCYNSIIVSVKSIRKSFLSFCVSIRRKPQDDYKKYCRSNFRRSFCHF